MDDQGIHFLGCKQSVRTIPINGKKVTTMTYDMEDFLKSCVKNYLELAGLTEDKLKHVATPFLPEGHRESQAGAPQPGDNPTTCPWCKHTFQTECTRCGPQRRHQCAAAQQPDCQGGGSDNQARDSDAKPEGKTAKKKKKKTSEHVDWGNEDPNEVTSQEGSGRLQPIAAKVLMKILYGARLARFDLLRAVCHLACHVTRWTSTCDRRLHRLVCYIQSSLHIRMFAWVGDEPGGLDLHLYSDADFANQQAGMRSTSGVFMAIRGQHS